MGPRGILAQEINRGFLALKIENFQLIFFFFFFFFIFLSFTENIDCGYTLEPPRRGGSNEYLQSMCFGAKRRKIGIPLHTPVYYVIEGYTGVLISRICFPGVSRGQFYYHI